MRLFIFLTSFFIFNIALAGDTKTTESEAPVFEPITQDLNARLAKVEKAINNSALLDMLELLESLKTEVSTLRGQIEVQTHTIEQLKQRQRDLYTDVDNRLQRIESNKSTTSIDATSTVAEPETTQESITETENTTAKTNTTSAEPDSEAKEPADPAKAEAVYQKAFKLLKESQYDQALAAFKAFLIDYPNSPFSDNAQYWIGEANYVMQKYDLAINEYQTLLNTFPDSKKVSHALLKIGYSYAELGNAADAEKTLKKVKSQYPGTTAARLADERLRKIGSEKESNT
ncbi:MAG: tol-pal system protein YbgF [Proteobacteria bacterium]|nr:tol-pal system protein YbgF [Pseudomonadota bacterium]NOG60750.1 tol-pal system protein YbgF [Pseudomonadota bacterium]